MTDSRWEAKIIFEPHVPNAMRLYFPTCQQLGCHSTNDLAACRAVFFDYFLNDGHGDVCQTIPAWSLLYAVIWPFGAICENQYNRAGLIMVVV